MKMIDVQIVCYYKLLMGGNLKNDYFYYISNWFVES